MNIDQLHALTDAALPHEALTREELEIVCLGPGTEILGDERGAAVVSMHRWGNLASAWLVLLAVDPAQQRRGIGRELIAAAVERCGQEGAVDLHLATFVPRYLWPGVDYQLTAALCCFEMTGFEEYGASYNMSMPTTFRAPPPPGVAIEREISSGAIDLARRTYPNWVDEVAMATSRGVCFSARDTNGETIAFACHSVCRRAWIGPMATDPARQSKGVGHALLSALCADIADQYGLDRAEISWVGPVTFYAKVGARVSRVFRNGRRRIRTL